MKSTRIWSFSSIVFLPILIAAMPVHVLAEAGEVEPGLRWDICGPSLANASKTTFRIESRPGMVVDSIKLTTDAAVRVKHEKQVTEDKTTVDLKGDFELADNEINISLPKENHSKDSSSLVLRDAKGQLFTLVSTDPVVILPKGAMLSLSGKITADVDQKNKNVAIIKDVAKLKNGESINMINIKLPFDAQLLPEARVQPWPKDFSRSEWLPSATPAQTLKVNASKLGLDFVANRDKLRACIRLDENPDPHPAAIKSVTPLAGSNDNVELMVDLPSSLKTNPFWTSASITVLTTDGGYFGESEFKIPGVGFALVVTVVVAGATLLLIAWVLLGHRIFSLDWIVGAGNKASLSHFQILLWTCVVYLGLIYVVALTGELFAITPQVLALLGIAGAGSIGARFVAVRQDRALVGQSAPEFADILKTDGSFDLYKLQMLVFTVGTVLFVAVRIVVDKAFPVLDANLLLLLGISNGIYVGAKAASGESPFRAAERLDLELKVLEEAKKNASDDLNRRTKEIAEIDAKINAAKANNDTAEQKKQEDEKKLREEQKKQIDAKIAALDKQIAEKKTARTKAIEKLSA